MYEIRNNTAELINVRRKQLNKFIGDLTAGFSLQGAKERLQPLTDLIGQNISLPLDDEDSEEETEPHGVVAARSNHPPPIIGDYIFPKEKKTLASAYDHLALNVTQEEVSDENFLRSRIKVILSLADVSDKERAQLIQKLMSRSYSEKKSQMADSDSDSTDVSDDEEVLLTTKDKTKTFHDPFNDILGCPHYHTNCKLECSICQKWFPCRFCHDSSIKDHSMQRDQTKHVLCMFCFTPQFPLQFCTNEACNEMLAEYYCSKCKLYDNDPNKDIYHCDDCGICRLGLGLNQDFFHCHKCNACISIDLKKNHRCIENSTHSNCCICGEYMFSSTRTVVFMLCGHAIHQMCYNEFTKHSYRCPICNKTVVNMEAQFRVLDKEIQEQPMPMPYGAWQSIIKCNDCFGKSKVRYHILGLKCEICKSYNTNQLTTLKPEKAEEEQVCSAPLGPIENSLNTNFGYDQEDHSQEGVKMNSNESDDSVDEDYIDNFIRINNNFDKYASLGDAFKDWVTSTKDKFN